MQRLSKRQQLYKKYRIQGMSQVNAARAAGYSETYARNARPEKVVKVCLADAFERAGLTDTAIIRHALEGLEAMKPPTENSPEWEDWNARHKYFETILKLTERLKEKLEVSGNITIELSNALQEARKRINAYGLVAKEN